MSADLGEVTVNGVPLSQLIGEPEWEYGIWTEFGWVHEPRGANYALQRRQVWHGNPEWLNGQPVIDAATLKRPEPQGETRCHATTQASSWLGGRIERCAGDLNHPGDHCTDDGSTYWGNT